MRREAVRHDNADLQARGMRLSYVSPRDVQMVANEYLATHPELLTQAERLIASEPIIQGRQNQTRRSAQWLLPLLQRV